MDELKALMGDAYKDGMTLEDVTNWMSGKKFGDLSSGKYVDVDKHNKTVQNLQNTIADRDKTINDNLTDDQKVQKQLSDSAKEIERLTKLLAQNQLDTNKGKVQVALNDGITLLGIKSDDKEFSEFVDNITTDNQELTLKNATYISKLIKDSYDKGKSDGTKNSLGNFGKAQGSSSSDGKVDSIGKELAQSLVNQNKTSYDYFSTK